MTMKLLHDHTYEVELVFTPLKGFVEKVLDRSIAEALHAVGADVDDVGVYEDLGGDTLSVKVLFTVARRCGVASSKLDEQLVIACADARAEAEDVGRYALLEEDVDDG